MKNFSILMLALAICPFTQEANAQDKKMPKPRILDDKTWTWEGSKDNYAKYSDLVFEVGMGNERNGVGCGDAGVEIENVRKVRLSVDASPVLARLDANAFAGFMVDYSTAEGYTKRVALSIGVHSDKRTTKTPIWGKVTTPDQYVDLGRKKEYDLDLKEWAPDGWNGKVWFTVTMQNTGRNTSLKATLLLPSEEDTLFAAKVIGRFDMSCAEIPKLDSHWLFTKEGRAIQDGNDMGAWSVVGGKTIITFSDKQFGLAVLSFTNEDTLVGKNEHRNGSVFNWVLKREKTEVAQKPKEDAGKKDDQNPRATNKGPFHELGRLPMRPDTPWAIAISPDGKLLASGGTSKDSRVYITDLRTCTPLYALEGHTKDVSAVVFSLDSKSLYSGSIDGTVREWDMATGIEKRTIVEAVAVNANKDVSSVFALALSPDGKMLAVACPYLMDGNILLVIRLLTVSGKELLAFPTGKEILWGLAFSPNGKMLATAGPNKIAKVWEVATGKELAELKGHKMAVRSVTFSPDGKFLATSGTDKAIKVWNVSLWAEIAAPTEQTLTDSKINSPAPVVFSPDGRFLAAGGIGDVVQVWDTGTNKRITAITVPTVMGSGGIVSLAFSSDSSLLAIGSSWDKRIHLWGLERPGSVAARLVNLGYSTEATVTRNQNVRTIFLSELMEENVKVELDWFRKNGTVRTGFKEEDKRDIPIEIHGVTSPHGIFMHPTHKSYASVSYPLRGRYSRFQATAAIPPVIEGQGDPASPLQFEVRGNGRILWKSRVLTELGQVDHCDIGLERLEGLNHLELRVNCPGRPNWAVAVWLEPRLVQKVVDFAKIDYSKGPDGEKVIERQGFDKEINKYFSEQGFIGLQGQFVRHGKLTNWHQQPMAGKEGRRLSEDYWFNGKRHGKLVQWYESGKVMREAVSEHGIEIGKDQWWHENGQRRVEAAYVNGTLNGMGTAWYDNGKKRNEGAWLSGKQQGNWTWWHDNGQKIREASWDKGQRDGKFIEWNTKGEKTVDLAWASGRIVVQDPPSPDDVASLIQAMTKSELTDVKVDAAVLLVVNGLEEKVPPSVLEKEAAKTEDAKYALAAIRDTAIIQKLLADKKARPINIRIDTATKKQQKLFDFMIDGFNSCITNASAYSAESDVILRFNANSKGWPLIEGSHIEGNLCHPLLISIYDKDGQRLARFTTKEVYTLFNDTFRQWDDAYKNGGYSWEPKLLGRCKRTLTFRLNARILRDAAVIEVGFCDARKP